jgi:L-fucose isomerase-like protein
MLTIALLRASLPSYFPEKHGVWARAEAMLERLCADEGVRLVVLAGIPQDARETARAMDEAGSENADLVLVLHGGFTMGDVAREAVSRLYRVCFWAVPEPARTGDVQLNNFVSLNMSLSIARGVRDLTAHPVQWYHGAPEEAALQRRMVHTIRALKAAKALEGARIGVVGGLAMTFYNMEVHTSTLRARLGVEVVHHDIHELTGRMAGMEPARVTAEAAAMAAAARVRGVSDQQMRLTAACALALRDIGAGYDALAVSDWPALQADPGMHPGAAFSWIETADGMPIASEGDVLGAVTQIVAKSLSGRTGALLDMTEPDFDADRLLVWHGGGGSLHLADGAGAAWINHPMIGRADPEGPRFGAIADYVFAPGEVTLLRVSRNGGALYAMGGMVVAQEPSGFDGCRGWLAEMSVGLEPASARDVVASVMGHGIEHHFVLIPGAHQAAALEFAAWTGMAPLRRRAFREYLDAGDYA